MREKLTLSALPVPKKDDVFFLQKPNNPDYIRLYWDCGSNRQHYGMVHYTQVFGYDVLGKHCALLAERKGKLMCLYCTGTK